MSFQAKLIITTMALLCALFVVELLRKRKLSESYTLLWFFVIGAVLFCTWAEKFLFSLTRFFGAITPVSTLTLLSLLFILLMLIFFSMKIYKMERRIKEMVQRLALENIRRNHPGTEAPPEATPTNPS